MFDFICMGPVELPGAQSQGKLQNEKIMPTAGFEPTPGSSSLRVHHLINLARARLFNKQNKALRIFPRH